MSVQPELTAFDFFPATRETALERLTAFTPNMGKTYASERNTDYGPEKRFNISLLSPFHAHRLLLESETVEVALEKFSPSEAEAFIQEVYWRTYFKGWLEQHPAVWRRTKDEVREQIADLAGERREGFDRACAGETGIACFDAWAKELVETGYLHNHARMWFASIWIFTLKLPWTLGADFFLRHLLDGDAASNTLSWRWVAGLHTKGKHYVATAANIAECTDGRFNPENQLASDPVALEDDWNEESAPLPVQTPPNRSAKSLLLLHEDDLGFDTLALRGIDIAGVVGITVTDDRSPLGTSEKVKQFTIEAMEDTLNRADDKMGCRAFKLPNPESVPEHAAEVGATQIIYPHAPVGPVRDRLDAAADQWASAGLSAVPLLRDWDTRAWPHCGKGFFSLKKKIPELIVLS